MARGRAVRTENPEAPESVTANSHADASTETVETPVIKKGDPFLFTRSETLVHVTLVREDGTFDIQEPNSERAWTAVSRDQLVDPRTA